MERIQRSLYWAVVASGTSHIFCCALPVFVSIMSLLSGAGLVAALPPAWDMFHDQLHHWELHLIVVSGLVLAFGWGSYLVSRRLDCLSTGCHHEPCGKQKKQAHLILKIATIIFLFNISVFAFHSVEERKSIQQIEHSAHYHQAHS